MRLQNHHLKEDDYGLDGSFGFDIRLMHMEGRRKTFYAGDLPKFEIGIPIAHRYALVDMIYAWEFGYSRFYMDRFFLPIPSVGPRVYPFGQYLSIYAHGTWGSFVFNNSTLTGEYGIEIDLPTSDESNGEHYVAFGIGYFHRKCYKWGNYIKDPQWYITSNGPLFTFSFRTRNIH